MLARFWTRPAKAIRFCDAKSKRFWLQINKQAGLLKSQLSVSRRRLFKTSKLIRSSARRLVTTKFLNRSAPAGWAKSIWPPTLSLGRKAALKLLPLRFTGDAERLKRFEREAHAVVQLNHPNILTVYEIGEDHSIHYIASELIEGETLRQRLGRGRIEVGEAVDVAIQVASALAAAHDSRELFIATSSRRTSCFDRMDT